MTACTFQIKQMQKSVHISGLTDAEHLYNVNNTNSRVCVFRKTYILAILQLRSTCKI